MPVCEGRPDGPCPEGKNDKSVHLSQGDLMLCRACEEFRFSAHSASALNNAGGKSGQSAACRVAVSAVSGAVNSVFVVNELLTYVKHYRNASNIPFLKKVVLNFFSASEISQAKSILLSKFSCLEETAFVTGRRGSSSRSKQEAELDDICGAIDFIDNKNLVQGICFVAINMDRIPKYGPEELNICAVVDRQRLQEVSIESLTERISEVETAVKTRDHGGLIPETANILANIERKISDVCASLSGRIDNTNANLSTLAESVGNMRGSTARSSVDNDSSMNIIIKGIPEDKDPSKWRTTAEQVLQFLVQRPVEGADAIRVGGRYRPDRTRPILIKLRSVWDKRLLLSSRRKMKDYSIPHIFILPDEPLETRRQQIFVRLKRKAESNGNTVSVQDGTLIIDGITVFTLQSGYVRNNN